MRILFVCRNFHDMAGGIERMATWIMNEMDRRGHQVCLITWDKKDAVSHYEMSKNILWNKLDIGNPAHKATWIERIKRQRKIRCFSKKFSPDVIIAFQIGAFLATRLAVVGFNYPVIAAERNSTDIYKHIRNGCFHQLVRNVFLIFSKRITVQLASYISKYPFYLRPKISVIPNPAIYAQDIDECTESKSREKYILCLGRLSYQKNHEFLLRSYALISSKYPDWYLAIVGDGDYAEKLIALKNELLLGEQCQFFEQTKNVSEWYNKSEFIVLPSLWEGFPNVLLEAFSHRLPAIGLESTSGVNELIIHGENGLLSEANEKKFAKSMELLMINDKMRMDMGVAATSSTEKYKISNISNLWEDLFMNQS